MSVSRWKPAAAGVAAVSTALLGVLAAAPADAQGPTCTPDVGGTGLSAAVVARSHQTIARRTVDAAGCDIGIYIGPGASHVRVDQVTVENANFQGIFAEKTSHVVIANSLVSGNGWHSTDPAAPPLPGSGVQSFVSQSFGISLFGVSHSLVAGNRVTDNGRGGIGVMDNGADDPGALADHQNPNAPLVGSSHDAVVGNRVWDNYSGCAIVAATQNPHGQLAHLTIAGNRITGKTGAFGQTGPDVGGIVVAADPPMSTVAHVDVLGNTVSDSFEGGVIVNAEAFDSSTRDVRVIANAVSGDNWGAQEAPKTAGIVVFANPQWNADGVPPGANPPVNSGTTVAFNTASNQFYGIWSMGQFVPKTFGNWITVTPGGVPIFHG